MPLGHSLILLALLAVPGDAPDEVVIGFPHSLTDGLGFRWDIRANGSIGDGTNDAYDGGVILHINDEPFPNQGSGKLVGARQVVLGPVEIGGVQVTRRIFVSLDDGLARFVEVFENRTLRPIRIRIMISSHLGGRIGTFQTASDDSSKGGGLIALVTDDGDPTGGDPAILHIVGAEGAPNLTKIQGRLGDRVLRYGLDEVVVPSNRKVLFVHAEAQRKTAADAIDEMDDLERYRIISDIPREERADLLNFRFPFHLPHDVDVPREEHRDVLTLRDGDAFYGEVLNRSYNAVTDFGDMDVPGERVVAIVGRDRPGSTRLYLKTGEVYRARLPDLVLDFHLPSGHSLRIPGDRIASLGFRKREGEVQGHDWEGQIATLISGDRLVGELKEEKLTIRTVYGSVTLPTERIARLQRKEENPGLHRVILRDGSILHGLLEEKSLRFRILSGRDVKITTELLKDLCLAVSSLPEDGPRIVLETGDEFMGSIGNPLITLETGFARIELDPGQLRSLKALKESRGEYRAVLWDDTTVTGDLRDEKITIHLQGGEEFTLHSALLAEAWNPYPELPDPIRARVEHLVSELGAPDYDRRESAEKELIQIGRPGLGLLIGFRDSEDPEIRERVRRILDAIS